MGHEEYYLRNIERTKKLLEESLTEDIILINEFRAYNEISEAVEKMKKVLKDWKAWYFPADETFSDLTAVSKHPSFKMVKELDKTIEINEEKKQAFEKDLFEKFRKLCPNTNAITREILGLKLLEKTGSLKKLANCTASKIQVLGAEKALFRHLTKGTKPPKYGLLFYHPFVIESSEEYKGKTASIIADKIAIASKIDYFKGKYIGDKLAEKITSFYNKHNQKSEEKKIKITETSFQNVYKYGNKLFTKNLITGTKHFGEILVKYKNEEYRSWDPVSSKLAAAIIKGTKATGLGKGITVLYLGASSGNTASYISDVIGEEGMIFAVEISPVSMRDLILICKQRKNIAPILGDAGQPETYKKFAEPADLVYQDVSQKNQLEIFTKNTDLFLKENGTGILCIKAKSIDSVKKPKEIFRDIEEELRKKYTLIDKILLEPYQKEHCVFVVRKLFK